MNFNLVKKILPLFFLSFFAHVNGQNVCSIEIPKIENKDRIILKQGTNRNPKGETIEISSEGMLWNGESVVPVMGELHFSRVPEYEWRGRLQDMKNGGITIVSTYIFWIHHEEIEGQYDWSQQRNLRKFLSLCRELDLKVVIRIGPWCHGEVRNGGIPDWVINKGVKLRESNEAYLAMVQKWYSEIFQQVEGLLWKDGGTVIGIQIENEYRGRWEHLADLKKLAVQIGFDVPLYTRTGWPALATEAVFGEIIPLYGDYSDGFWDRNLEEMPGDYSKAYLFRSMRNSTVIANEQLPADLMSGKAETSDYPYFTCELGGGMMPSYHRRINIQPMDIYVMTLVKVGSGSNLPGYYMYSGGTNPEGKLTSLEENQNTQMTNYNDLPVKSYDFQAPLGEFGQKNPHYYMLRQLHLFLCDFGSNLSSMKAYFPVNSPSVAIDGDSLRWSVRTDGTSGFIFVNNYQRLTSLKDKKDIQFSVKLPNETILFPEMDVKGGIAFIMPFNLKLGSETLKYATAQLLAKDLENGITKFYFSKIEGIRSVFFIEDKKIELDSNKRNYSFEDKLNNKMEIVLLDKEESLYLGLDEPQTKKISKINFEKISDYGALRTIPIGGKGVASSPDDKSFEQAAVWKLDLPQGINWNDNHLIRIKYKGDVARIYSGDNLITDNFYNGKDFEVRLSPKEWENNAIFLKILPLTKDAPIYFQSDVELNFNDNSVLCDLIEITVETCK